MLAEAHHQFLRESHSEPAYVSSALAGINFKAQTLKAAAPRLKATALYLSCRESECGEPPCFDHSGKPAKR